MSNFDLRALLQYVPQFRGRCFVVSFSPEVLEGDDWMDATLDLAALQGLGVRLVVAAPERSYERLFEQLVRLDLKVAKAGGGREISISTVLERGQAAVVAYSGAELAPEVVELSVTVRATKLMWILGGALPQGESRDLHAIPASESLPETDQSQLMQLAFDACRAGIRRVHLLDGRMPNVMLSELFSNEGVGVMVYSDAYRELAPLTEEDIPELLSLIGRSVYDATLLDRSYEDISNRLGDYHVLKIDGNVVGSVALHGYPEEGLGEIACLRIKDNHERLGYGQALVAYIEERAREAGLAGIFALSQSATAFFRDRVKYQEWSRSDLPEARRKVLESSGRGSLVFGKKLLG